jgi:hypothetical protein
MPLYDLLLPEASPAYRQHTLETRGLPPSPYLGRKLFRFFMMRDI